MASSGNFATFNPLKYKASSYTTSGITSGNLQLSSKTGNAAQLSMGFVNGDGKFYFEVYAASIPSSLHYGVCIGNADLNNVTAGKAIIGYRSINGNKLVSTAPQTNSTQSAYGATFTGGDIMGCAVDFTNGTIEFYKNNVSQGQFSWSSANDGSTYYPFVYQNTGIAGVNCGQDSTFCGLLTAGGNADDNGFGDFYYAPPSGFLAMCSANLPIGTGIDPAGDDGADENPTKQFGVVTYTGNATTGQAITGMGCQPDLVWAKMRSSTQSNFLSDTSRGINNFLQSDNTDAERTGGGYTTVYSSFDSDGFTLGTSGSGPNDSGRTYVAWGWRANGGVTSSNSSGSITSTVQANTKSGFSIITYTGTGSNATIGHGLSSAPDFFIVKSRSGGTGRNWAVYHSTQGATKYAELDNNGQFYTSSLRWNDTEPTNSLISLGTTGSVNASSENFVCYAWHNVEGFQKFGSYVGNGNDDGSYIHLGFRARYFFLKEASANDDWVAYDTARSTFNPTQKVLRYDTNAAEFDGSGRAVDVLSNGLKIRTSNGTINTSGNTYIFGAWGDVPFKYNNTF